MPDPETPSEPTYTWLEYLTFGSVWFAYGPNGPSHDTGRLYNPELGSMQTTQQAAAYVVERGAPVLFYGARQAPLTLDARAVLLSAPPGVVSDTAAADLQRALDGWARAGALRTVSADPSVRVRLSPEEAACHLANDRVYELSRGCAFALAAEGKVAKLDPAATMKRLLLETQLAGLIDAPTRTAMEALLRPAGVELGPPKVGGRRKPKPETQR